jgi:alginate O-acetyltransferase complex protein AlgJ
MARLSRRKSSEGGDPLTAAHVRAVYAEVLGREPDEGEVTEQLGLPDLEAMLRLALGSQEFEERQRAINAGKVAHRPAVVNVFHPDLADYALPPGTRSPDEVAIVGHDGSLFLCGGTNSNLGQHLGTVEMAPTWESEWRQIVLARRAELGAMGLPNALLVVPDKLAVYEERYPEPLEKVGPRPVERLLADPELGLLYPLAELRATAATEDVYLRTDTHLTFRGNEVLFRSLLEPLGIESAPDFSALPMRSYPSFGDLGSKFEPGIVSIMHEPNTLGAAEIVEDNRAEIEAVGGHIGTRRVFRNENATDPRVAVIFGDSFGFSAAYYQGVSWFMAQVFRETHFVWVPFGWDPDYTRRIGAEAVLIQGAERFVGRVPHPRSEVAALAAETLRRKQAIGVEAVFD